MKQSPRWLHAFWLFIGLFVFFAACKNTPDPVPTPAVPTIASIDPATAPVGSTIAINGTNFNTTPGSNTVTIGGVSATIVSASATRLVVTVPQGAQNGPVSLTVGGQTTQSTTTFTLAPNPLRPVVELQGTLFRNRTLSKDTVYLLRGFVYVAADYTMTIQAGTVIKGAGADADPLNQGNAGTLVVERRGKLIANGTASEPIVFTSNKPAGQRFPGDWGGVVLVGKSPTNRPGTTTYAGGIRGTAETYSEPEDNSGSLQYVRIEYAGTGQRGTPTGKLAGLTLIGVGTGTVLNHIQVTQSSGDSFGWFGGGVQAKYLVSNRATDDDWSTDWGYTGQVQFGVALRDANVADPSGSNAFESQNYDPGENADGTPLTRLNGLPQTAPVFANMSNFAAATTPTAITAASPVLGYYQSGIYLRRNTAISIYNSLIYGYPEGVRLEGTLTGLGASLTSGAIDLRGNVFANTLTPVAGGGAVTDAVANTYLTAATRSNQLISSGDIGSLMLNGANFNATTPNFLPQTGSTLLGGAVTGGKLTGSFFTQTTYRGAFGTDNWIAGWTNFNPQNTDYDRKP
ncbi:IPT/TIG domain-containing protein [Fibrivirga algicola]|uniref:Cell shape-determining protein MreB n=1 Tax=Fibrivirga algicola TaxID=2950420 RepID=A0ABX0Q9E8_9BACT|nr:IPT/TIG domain-containing protein [Fibrivirga algicola]ARK09131.1 cell shape-determining protein MreB [Fibrella sp. ES10-3-2-2]NID08754.1 cell shape-determining protein MreB [Fibrivirga algicola]